MIFNVGGRWPLCCDKLLDAAVVGRSKSVLADGDE
jgi:hypothetical protein